MKNSFIGDKSGFTAIELLIAIQLSFIVISFGYVSYLFSAKLVHKWQEKVLVENSVARVSQTVSRAVDQIHEVVIARDKYLVAITHQHDTLSMSVEEGLVFNSKNLVKGIFQFEHGMFKYFHSTENPYTAQHQLTETRDCEKIDIIELDLVFKRANNTYRYTVRSRLVRKKQHIRKLNN